MRLITVLIILIVGIFLIQMLCNYYNNKTYTTNTSNNISLLPNTSNNLSLLPNTSNNISLLPNTSNNILLLPNTTNNLSTQELVNNIHNESGISISNKCNNKKMISLDTKDLSVAKDRNKYSTEKTVGYDNNTSRMELDNYPNQYDIMNDDTIKSVLQNISTDTFMMNENDNMYVSSNNNVFSDRYFELENKQVIKKPKKILNVPMEIKVNSKIYNLLGVAYNEYYNQYYLIYENIIKTNNDNNYLEDNLNNLSTQVAEYILAKIKNDKNIEIIHEISPRNKINYNEVVYLSYGNFQLGPLLIKNIN